MVNPTRVQAYSDIVDAKLRYPNTALLFVAFDAKQFNNIPQISIKARGRQIRVPNNYDPASRTTTGTWDGTFKWAYSNNPAWVFYDVLLDKRFGLGNRLEATQIDKWELYRIAAYCDWMVDNGNGGKEPRFLCDIYIQSQNEAFNVLRDLAAIFRGMTYWAQNQLYTLADMPPSLNPNDQKDTGQVYTYTRANVINGKFTYAGGSEKNRFSTALVSWSNPANHYADEVEAVVEQDLIRRYGVKQTEMSAIGCTRQSEANRRGRWALLTNSKDRMVTFSTGLDGYLPLPGYIVGVQDAMLSGGVMGGRIHAADSNNPRQITLDRRCDGKVGDRLLINTPKPAANASGYDERKLCEARTITAITRDPQNANRDVITVATGFSNTPEVEAIWSIDSPSLAVQLYRVTSVNDNDDGTFTISAVFHNPNKYAYIDSGVRLIDPTISKINTGTIAAPKNILIRQDKDRVYQNMNIASMKVTWDPVPGAVAYEIQWRKDNNDWVNYPRTAVCGFTIEGIYAGDYIAQVRAIDISEVSSPWGQSAVTPLLGKLGMPPALASFTATDDVLWGIRLDWLFANNSEDTLHTEIRYHPSKPAIGDIDDHGFLCDVPYPQRTYTQAGLAMGQEFWYKARIVDRIGNAGPWTGWIQGLASSDASAYLVDIDAAIKASPEWAALTQQIQDLGLDPGEGIERDIINALANHAVFQEERRDDIRATAAIKQITQVIADNQQALALQIDEFKTRFDDNESLIQLETKARSDALSAIADQIQKLEVKVGTDVVSQIQTAQRAQATVNNATAQDILTMKSDIKGNKSSIETLSKTYTDETKSTALSISQVTTNVSNLKTTVETTSKTQATLNGQFSSSWGVKVQAATNGTYTIAGMQIGVNNTDPKTNATVASGKATSKVIFLADTFAIYNGTKEFPPFAVEKGTVFINSACIRDAAITNAKIGGVISSTGYQEGVKGWALNKNDGSFELNSAAKGKVGTIKMGNGLITITDGKVTRIKMGIW